MLFVESCISLLYVYSHMRMDHNPSSLDESQDVQRQDGYQAPPNAYLRLNTQDLRGERVSPSGTGHGRGNSSKHLEGKQHNRGKAR